MTGQHARSCIKIKKAGGPEVITGVIMKDHKPEDKSEKKRIKALGGSVSSKGVGRVKKKVHHTNQDKNR